MALLLLACNRGAGSTDKGDETSAYMLQGAWTLHHVHFPYGDNDDHYLDDNATFCSIYDGDSMLYECKLSRTPSGLVITPTEKVGVTLLNTGNGELLYFEDNDPHPLVVSDSTICVQRQGMQFVYQRADDIYREWGSDIRDIIIRETESNDETDTNRYVLSSKEREQESTIHGLIYTILGIIVVLLILGQVALILGQVALANNRSKKRLQLQLQQIQEAHDARPQPVKQAMKAVEEAFFASEDYARLHKRMADGARLNEDDWTDVERQLKAVYPGFTSQLRGLRPLSELEYQVCLLIKLRIPPKDMANVLSRDVSTISTVRSRLYQKVFGQKGSSKEWDDFILSIDA